MDNQIYSAFEYLNLPFSASREQVLINQKTRIKVARAMAKNNQTDPAEEIEKINQNTNLVLEYISSNNGKKIKQPLFRTTLKELLISVCFLLLIIGLIIFMFMH